MLKCFAIVALLDSLRAMRCFTQPLSIVIFQAAEYSRRFGVANNLNHKIYTFANL